VGIWIPHGRDKRWFGFVTFGDPATAGCVAKEPPRNIQKRCSLQLGLTLAEIILAAMLMLISVVNMIALEIT